MKLLEKTKIRDGRIVTPYLVDGTTVTCQGPKGETLYLPLNLFVNEAIVKKEKATMIYPTFTETKEVAVEFTDDTLFEEEPIEDDSFFELKDGEEELKKELERIKNVEEVEEAPLSPAKEEIVYIKPFYGDDDEYDL